MEEGEEVVIAVVELHQVAVMEQEVCVIVMVLIFDTFYLPLIVFYHSVLSETNLNSFVCSFLCMQEVDHSVVMI